MITIILKIDERPEGMVVDFGCNPQELEAATEKEKLLGKAYMDHNAAILKKLQDLTYRGAQ